MMANCFATQLQQIKEKQYRAGVMDGMRMGFDVVAIALNHTFGFGDERLSRLEVKVQELVDEIVDTADPLVTRVHIEKALNQIRGEDWDK